MGHGGARQWGGATEDAAQRSELLGVQGSASADEVDRVSACEAGEKGGTELLHRGHVVRRKLADGLQIAMALARVLWRGDKDWTARLLPRRERGSRGGRRLGAGAAATTAERLGQRGAATLTLLGWVGWEHREGDNLLSSSSWGS